MAYDSPAKIKYILRISILGASCHIIFSGIFALSPEMKWFEMVVSLALGGGPGDGWVWVLKTDDVLSFSSMEVN